MSSIYIGYRTTTPVCINWNGARYIGLITTGRFTSMTSVVEYQNWISRISMIFAWKYWDGTRYIGLITTSRFNIASCEMGCAVLTIFKSMLQTDLKNILIEKVPILEILTVSWVSILILIQLDQILKMTTFSWAPVFFNNSWCCKLLWYLWFSCTSNFTSYCKKFFLIKVAVASLCDIFSPNPTYQKIILFHLWAVTIK